MPTPRALLAVYAALLILTGATVAAAYFDLGVFNPVVALFIAGAKTLLVVLIFMQVRWSWRLVQVFAFASVFWLALLVGGVLTDLAARPPLALEEGPAIR